MTLLDALAWLGTVTFAVTGALEGVRRRFDLVGVMVLAAVTAVGGGSIRDVIVGRLPPSSFTDEGLLWSVALSAVATFVLHGWIREEGRLMYALDTLGLAIFAALGAERGLTYGLGMWGAVFAGAVSGVGGGVLRDVLAGRVPGILYRFGDFYASAAALGALSVWALHPLSPSAALLAGVGVTLAVRIGSRMAGLELPVPRGLPGERRRSGARGDGSEGGPPERRRADDAPRERGRADGER